MAHPNTQPTFTVQGGAFAAQATLLGQGPARIPTGGKIRAGIKVLTKKAAEQPTAKAIYDDGVAAGQSFEQIERAIAEALPNLKTPLIDAQIKMEQAARSVETAEQVHLNAVRDCPCWLM